MCSRGGVPPRGVARGELLELLLTDVQVLNTLDFRRVHPAYLNTLTHLGCIYETVCPELERGSCASAPAAPPLTHWAPRFEAADNGGAVPCPGVSRLPLSGGGQVVEVPHGTVTVQRTQIPSRRPKAGRRPGLLL